jgi:hypothetical protein
MLFNSEKEMQKWFRKIIETESYYGIIRNNYVGNYENSDEKKILDVFEICIESFSEVEIITDDQNISLLGKDSLRPDFLLYSPSSQGWIIVELKNIPNPSRQAGTELSAYAAELRTQLIHLSDGDISNIIISTAWPTLLCHYVSHEILWMGRKILCLKPEIENDDIVLSVVNPKIFTNTVNINLSAYEIGGYQLCLYDNFCQHTDYDPLRLDQHVAQMRKALEIAKNSVQSLQSHGFAFLWKDHSPSAVATYSITLVNAASFQSFGHILDSLPPEAPLGPLQKGILRIAQEYSPTGQTPTLEIMRKSIVESLSNIARPFAEGFHTWDILSYFMENQSGGDLIDFVAWGRFGKRFDKLSLEQYEAGAKETTISNTDLGLQVVEELISWEKPPPLYHWDQSKRCDDLLF